LLSGNFLENQTLSGKKFPWFFRGTWGGFLQFFRGDLEGTWRGRGPFSFFFWQLDSFCRSAPPLPDLTKGGATPPNPFKNPTAPTATRQGNKTTNKPLLGWGFSPGALLGHLRSGPSRPRWFWNPLPTVGLGNFTGKSLWRWGPQDLFLGPWLHSQLP